MHNEVRRAVSDPENSSAYVASLVSRARVDGKSAYIGALTDRQTWNKLSASLQDAVVSVVDELLGESFVHVDTATYECVDRAHRIATFEHVKSGALMNMIPGRPSAALPPMLVGRTPVTQEVWDTIKGEDNRRFRGPKRPIEGVTWHSARAWADKAGDGLRLPTEAEWTYACAAGPRMYWGYGDWDEVTSRGFDCFWVGSETKDVALLEPNAFGLYDMHGNVEEWCEDLYPRSGYYFRQNERLVKGGSYRSSFIQCMIDARGYMKPDDSDGTIGFRVVRAIC